MLFFEFQLQLCRGISYAAVAAHADKNGRRKLAAMLVEHEPRSSKQVKFLILFFISFTRSFLKFTIVCLLIMIFFTSGSTSVKHRRGRYSFNEGNRKRRH